MSIQGQPILAMLPGLQAALEARTLEKKTRILQAVSKSADRNFAHVQNTVRRRTHYMALHTRLEFFAAGYGYRIGWRRSDFVGKINPVTRQRITFFYPKKIELGDANRAGDNVLKQSNQRERPNLGRELREILSS